MRRIAIAFFSACLVTGIAVAGTGSIDSGSDPDHGRIGRYRHFILQPMHPLTEQEQADLASKGVLVRSALSNGRLLIAVVPGSTASDRDPRIRSLVPLTADVKMQRTALREAASGKPFATLNVFFNEDVSFDDAKAAIEAAGGTLEEPLQNEFHVLGRIPVRIAAGSVRTLAADERVLMIYGPLRLRPASDNRQEADASSVTPLYGAPYGLTGQGVTLSYFELGQADASHPEFGGRLTTNMTGGSSSDKSHATHVGGTMIASGISPEAKGMAPAAMLQEFSAADDNFLDTKKQLPTYASVADNNSWGYIVGWCEPSSDSNSKCYNTWVWDDSDVYYGAYDSWVSAALDKITRSAGVLMVHSAGNDAQKTGPSLAPYSHAHLNANGDKVTGYCYSSDGSGNDCPAPTCNSGMDPSSHPFCETVPHPQITSDLPAPWLSVGLTASAKNVLTVGAVNGTKEIASFSSRGPARDGRIKPDVVARGVNVLSTIPGNSYATKNGTSMAAPVATGVAGLIAEQWRRTFGGATPSPAAIKTLLIATAEDLGNPGPDYTYGFGLVNAKSAIDTILADMSQGRRIKIARLATGEEYSAPVTLQAGQKLRVTVGWSDPEVLLFPLPNVYDSTDPLAASALVNDLDVKVVDSAGNVILPYVLDKRQPDQPAARGVNTIDNTEMVELTSVTGGIYRIVVSGRSVTASSPQEFALVASSDMAAVVPCSDVNEPNDVAGAATGLIGPAQAVRGSTCSAGDVDFFKFAVTRSGPVSVTVTATDTPLRVTLTSSVTATATVDVPAGTSATVSTQANVTQPVVFFVSVQAAGAIGSSAQYTLVPSFSGPEGRRRVVHR